MSKAFVVVVVLAAAALVAGQELVQDAQPVKVLYYPKGMRHRHGPGLVPAVRATRDRASRRYVEAQVVGEEPRTTPQGVSGKRLNGRDVVHADVVAPQQYRRVPSQQWARVHERFNPKSVVYPSGDGAHYVPVELQNPYVVGGLHRDAAAAAADAVVPLKVYEYAYGPKAPEKPVYHGSDPVARMAPVLNGAVDPLADIKQAVTEHLSS